MAGSSLCVCVRWLKNFPFVLTIHTNNSDDTQIPITNAVAATADYDNSDNIINLETFSDREPMP